MNALRAWWRRTVGALRQGAIIRFGPVTVLLTRHFQKLLARLHVAELGIGQNGTAPFSGSRPGGGGPTPAKRSVLFLHNCYYNFFYLAEALRRRGWDALSVSLESPNSPHAKYYHGEDLNLFDEDPLHFQNNVQRFFATVPDRFRMVHFYGTGLMSFFPLYYDDTDRYEVYPADFAFLRQTGVKIGYTISGCLDGVAQTSVSRWSETACATCPYRDLPRACSDPRNLAWGHKVHLFCDLIATEGFPALDYQRGAKCYREPLTSAEHAVIAVLS